MHDDDVVRPLPPRPTPRRPRGSGVARWRTRFLVVVIPLLLLITSILSFWVDVLWFTELGQRGVLFTRFQWAATMGIGFGLLTFAVMFTNFTIARRVARNDLYVPFLAVGADPDAPEQPVVPHYVLKPVLLGVAAVASVLAGLIMSARWETVLRFIGRTDFGVKDPQFGHDASFYVFTMPLLELATRSLQVLIVLTSVAVVIAYVATGVIRYTPVPRVARGAIVHLSWLVASFLVISALQFRLSMWDLATSESGVVAGAGWTDVHARIPGYWFMLVASLILAVVVVMYARRERWRVVGGAVVGWFIASTIVTGVIPGIVQNVLVEPNELERESTLIEGNIANTRSAYGLGAIRTFPFSDEAKLNSDALLTGNVGTTDNLRLWSPFVLQRVLQQDQVIRRYYTFQQPDVDRYTIGGDYRQVMVSVRELDPAASAVSAGWTNEKLAYTHGYGAVATLPNEVTSQGKPEYLLRNLPPTPTEAGEALALKRPEVYFGELTSNFVIVATRQGEISGASRANETSEGGAGTEEETGGEDATVRTSYEGKGGIRVNTLGRRIAFASTFRDPQILFSNQFTDDSRLMFRRSVTERIEELAPFLELDGDPYAVINDGRIKWIVDAYTTSDRFPYSNSVSVGTGLEQRRFNYMRNSVKVVVDAYDGDVELYVSDDKDPILRAWRNIFPDLFQPLSKMPEALREHVRYPSDLFEVQTKLWTRYHMTEVPDFYSRDDEWAVPEIDGREMEAYYVLAKIPGTRNEQRKEELLLIRPLTPLSRKNMVSYMAARNDGEFYGEVLTLRLSTDRVTQGPSQMQARIKQDTEVSRQVREWTTGRNEVIFGDLLVLPVERSLLYVQPVYLQNREAEIPEFQRIVVALGDDIAWGETYAEAVERLLSEGAADVQAAADEDAQDAGGDAPTPVPTPDAGDLDGLSQAQLQTLVVRVSAAYDRAAACQATGDTVCYAREIEQIESLLDAAKRGTVESE